MYHFSLQQLNDEDRSRLSQSISQPATGGGFNRSLSVCNPGANKSTSGIIHAAAKPGKSAFDRNKNKNNGEDGDSEEEDEDEFYDCRENLDDTSSLAKWSSMELTPADGDQVNILLNFNEGY